MNVDLFESTFIRGILPLSGNLSLQIPFDVSQVTSHRLSIS